MIIMMILIRILMMRTMMMIMLLMMMRMMMMARWLGSLRVCVLVYVRMWVRTYRLNRRVFLNFAFNTAVS